MDNDCVLDFAIKNIFMFMLAKNLYTVRIMLFPLIRFIGKKINCTFNFQKML
jgi:hypothetical protein